ncbi:MAG TPA: carboxylesterase family protein [Mycobacteriales bacterium]|nr:carboxylesterase family protein [Mycobacteriales bacterium]
MDGATRPVVRTRHGWVRGFRAGSVEIFRGVPYGRIRERFRPAEPPEPWDDIRDAGSFGPMAPQNGADDRQLWEDPRIGRYVTGGRAQELIDAQVAAAEDCLVLNVLTPARGGERPVMVFLHGGGLDVGSGTEQTLSERFVQEQDVVLVTVNHRLNAFGFLYLGELSGDYPIGNVGLLDLVLALEWVRGNIAKFGGDPGRVTIFGPSGGGTKVLSLLGMPAAAGLFHRAIVHSAGPPTPVHPAVATATSKELLTRLDADIDDLPKVPVAAIRRAMKAGGRLRFRTVVDGHTITEPIWRSTVPEPARGIPLIIGNCRDEMSLFAGFSELDPAVLLPKLAASTGLPVRDLAPVVEVFRAGRPTASARDVFLAVMSARLQAVGIAIAEMHSGPAYHYRFAFDSGIADLGAFHTADVPLCTRLVLRPEAEPLSRVMSAAWAAFARTGNPGLPGWQPYGPDRTTMVFGADVHAVADLAAAEREAVAALPPLSNG